MPSLADATVQLNGFSELLEWASDQTDTRADFLLGEVNAYMAQHPMPSLTWQESEIDALTKIMREKGFTVTNNGNGQFSGAVFQETAQTVTQNAANSNLSQIFRGDVRKWYGGIKEYDGQNYTFQMTKFPASGGLGAKAQYLVGSVAGPVMAASAGIKLGKAIDSTLYNLNPDFWNDLGLETINPETWGRLTEGSDSPFAGLLDMILGIDPDTGTGQMYMNADALAYMAYALNASGIFAPSTNIVDSNVVDGTIINTGTYPIPFTFGTGQYCEVNLNNYRIVKQYTSTPVYFTPYIYISNGRAAGMGIIHGSPNPYNYGSDESMTRSAKLGTLVIDGVTHEWYYGQTNSSGWQLNNPSIFSTFPYNIPSGGLYAGSDSAISFVMLENGHEQTAIQGIGNQPNATLPDTSTWEDIPSTLQSLQQQYPDWFTNAMQWNDDYGDTSGNTSTWIPVPFPYIETQYSQPTSVNPNDSQQQQTQTDTDIQPSFTPDVLTDIIAQVVQQTKTQTQPNTETPSDNPTDTGTGDTTPPIVPTGSASALWSVYHPTQAQVNSFGAWLWSDDFIDNIKKIMNDPMAGIITLHKIFATPVDSGSGTIVVGKLDSEVPSSTVNQQYVTVDCGSVDLYEQFGNVFDYNPFTDVSLYLPFIGIVQLDTADVMRSTIHITYGVDVYTGACLAQVEVSRDGCTVNMYQYAGVCSVEYPLTGAQHNGLITGLLGIGTSVAGLVTGNLPMAAGAIGGAIASAAKRSQSRANSFSGNAGAMGIKKPYLIISRPQTKVASTFPALEGYPTNYSTRLGDCSGQVRVRAVHVEGIPATETELREIENLLMSGILV